MNYKLIACDMDGTALTRDKRLTAETVAAMDSALSMGKHVVFCTGRNLSIVKPYMDMVPRMRYAITGSGATVNDTGDGRHIFDMNIDPETIKWIISAAAGLDVLCVLYDKDTSWCPTWAQERAGDFFVADFGDTYRRYMSHTEDVFQMFMENPQPVQKLNLLFTQKADADFVYEQIKNLPISFTSRTELSMEINALGVSKARGLEKLCRELGITMEECIAIGDAENDAEIIKAAGLGLAVNNASEEIKALADAIVADCDKGGVAQAIEQFLL